MTDQENGFSPEESRKKRPNTLDIIKIDGRWAQIYSSGVDRVPIKYLDQENTFTTIDFTDYRLVQIYDTAVNNLDTMSSMPGPSPEELARAAWQSESGSEDTSDLKKHIRIFGEYASKN
ncbi:hypothetical protein GYA13_03565 [Candidatus Kuenenbacteria bacterium]|nr:hypothetical protein [Candidatus Kuenenbacteria bacterium]